MITLDLQAAVVNDEELSNHEPIPQELRGENFAPFIEKELGGQDGEDRDIATYSPLLEVVFTSITTAGIMPFMQAIASKAGEDVWASIRERVPRRRHRRIERDLDSAQLVQVVDVEQRIVVRMPHRLPASAAPGLTQLVQELRNIKTPVLIVYEPEAARWDWTFADLSEPDIATALRRATRSGADLPSNWERPQ